MFRRKLVAVVAIATLAGSAAVADAVKQTKGNFKDKFRQLEEILPTPNVYRNAAGEPGHAYWQQKVDYKIKVSLDEANRRLNASEAITYTNNSPDTLKYLWLQLDQNRFKADSMGNMTRTFSGTATRNPTVATGDGGKPAKLSLRTLRRQQRMADVEHGYSILAVKDSKGNDLNATIVGTNMRVDLPTPLKPGQTVKFSVDFAYNIVEQKVLGGRAGYEHFPDDAREGGTTSSSWHSGSHACIPIQTMRPGRTKNSSVAVNSHLSSATMK